MITLSILIVLALICALVGVLMGLFSLIGLLASLLVGVLVGALAGHIANRFMGTQTSTGRNIVLGILGSFVGEFLFGLIGIHATGSISSFVISVLGACVCIWVDNRLFHATAGAMETLQNDQRIWPNVWLHSIFTEEGETGWRTCGKRSCSQRMHLACSICRLHVSPADGTAMQSIRSSTTCIAKSPQRFLTALSEL